MEVGSQEDEDLEEVMSLDCDEITHRIIKDPGSWHPLILLPECLIVTRWRWMLHIQTSCLPRIYFKGREEEAEEDILTYFPFLSACFPFPLID